MSKKLLNPDRLTPSEILLVIGTLAFFLTCGVGALCSFPEHPVLVAGLLGAMYWGCIGRWRNSVGERSGVHGTARFCTAEDAAVAGLTGQTKGLILGIGDLPGPSKAAAQMPPFLQALRTPGWQPRRVRSRLQQHYMRKSRRQAARDIIRLPSWDKAAHCAVYMPSGAGKTRGVVRPNLLNVNLDENAWVYDPSGEMFLETAEYRRKRFGDEIRLLDPFGVCRGHEADQLNVMDLVNRDELGCFDFARNLSHAMVPEKQNTNQDPFWHNSTIVGTETILYSILKVGDDEHRNLRTLTELLAAKRLLDLAQALSKSSDDLLRRRGEQLLNFQGKTLSNLLGCMTAEHSWLDSPAFAKTLERSSFCLRNLFRKKMTLYVVIPGNRAVESQQFSRMILTASLYAAFEAGPDIRRRPVRFYLDEAATLGRLDALMMLYSQGRKFSLRSCTFFQSIGQVIEIMGTPDRVHTFRSCMAAELFKAQDYATCKEVSDWIGQTTERTESTSEQGGRNSGWSNSTGAGHANSSQSGGTNEGWGRTQNETGVPLIRPEQILQLGARQAIALISGGVPPVKVQIIHGEEADNCGDASSQARYERKYLNRIRFNAFVMWLPPLCVLAFVVWAWPLLQKPHGTGASVMRQNDGERVMPWYWQPPTTFPVQGQPAYRAGGWNMEEPVRYGWKPDSER